MMLAMMLMLMVSARFDLRPFLYPAFSWPYKKIEAVVARMAAEGQVEDKKTA